MGVGRILQGPTLEEEQQAIDDSWESEIQSSPDMSP